jgi:hypothetical protein
MLQLLKGSTASRPELADTRDSLPVDKATQPEVEIAASPVRLVMDWFHSRIEEYRLDGGTGFASCASGGGESKLDWCRQMVTRVTDPNDACLYVTEDHSPPYTAPPQGGRGGAVGQLAWSSINQPGPGEWSEKLVA